MPRSIPIQKALGGTWRTTDGRDPATILRRRWFLLAVERLSPQCLEDLAGKVQAREYTLRLVNQQADTDTMLRVVLERGELREAK